MRKAQIQPTTTLLGGAETAMDSQFAKSSAI
jgi:hypothetical protein